MLSWYINLTNMVDSAASVEHEKLVSVYYYGVMSVFWLTGARAHD